MSRDGERKAVRLVGTVVRILADDHHPRLPQCVRQRASSSLSSGGNTLSGKQDRSCSMHFRRQAHYSFSDSLSSKEFQSVSCRGFHSLAAIASFPQACS